MQLPTPKTALGKAAERAIFVAIVAGLGYFLKDPQIGGGGLVYFSLKTIYDILNSNVKNL